MPSTRGGFHHKQLQKILRPLRLDHIAFWEQVRFLPFMAQTCPDGSPFFIVTKIVVS